MHQRISGAGTVQTEDVRADRADILDNVVTENVLTGLSEPGKAAVGQQFADQANTICGFGLVPGRSHAEIASDPERLGQLMGSPWYLRKLGQIAAVEQQ